jgi:hypothetical protein
MVPQRIKKTARDDFPTPLRFIVLTQLAKPS